MIPSQVWSESRRDRENVCGFEFMVYLMNGDFFHCSRVHFRL